MSTPSSISLPLQTHDSNSISPKKRSLPSPSRTQLLPKRNSNNNTPKRDDYSEILPSGTRYDEWFRYRHLPEVSFGSSESPCLVLGTNANDKLTKPRVLSPALMECLQGFFPFAVSQDNFWLKYSLARDGASLETFLCKVHGCSWTVIAIETTLGEVFGSLTAHPWHVSPNYYGSGESFLWKLKTSRILSRDQTLKDAMHIDTDLEIYPFTGYDRFVQHCTHDKLVVGGGQWRKNTNDNPYADEREGVGLELGKNFERGKTGSCSTFANRVLCHEKGNSANDEKDFNILNLEAWTLTPCNTIKQAEGLTQRKIFIDEN